MRAGWPAARFRHAGCALDALTQIFFGGYGVGSILSDTWVLRLEPAPGGAASSESHSSAWRGVWEEINFGDESMRAGENVSHPGPRATHTAHAIQLV